MMMPPIPRTTAQARDILKRAPVAALATMSPMSMKPPRAVSTPRVTPSIFFIGRPRREADSLVALTEDGQVVTDATQRPLGVDRALEAPATGLDPHGRQLRHGLVEQ